MKKLLWTALATTASIAGATLATRAATWAWIRATGEEPPEQSMLTRALAGPLARPAGNRLGHAWQH